MKQAHLHLLLPSPEVDVSEAPAPSPWWEAPEFLALAEVRRAMARGPVPEGPPTTAEESARHAVFWALFEIDHFVRNFGRRVAAGESVRVRSGIYKHAEARVDFNLCIVEHPEVEIQIQSPRSAP